MSPQAGERWQNCSSDMAHRSFPDSSWKDFPICGSRYWCSVHRIHFCTLPGLQSAGSGDRAECGWRRPGLSPGKLISPPATRELAPPALCTITHSARSGLPLSPGTTLSPCHLFALGSLIQLFGAPLAPYATPGDGKCFEEWLAEPA